MTDQTTRDTPPPLSGPHRLPGDGAASLAEAIGRGADGAGGPLVTALGRDAVAERILALAFAHGVPVREDPDLANILGAIEVGQEIPLEALFAVTRLLEYVYRANQGGGPDVTKTLETYPHGRTRRHGRRAAGPQTGNAR